MTNSNNPLVSIMMNCYNGEKYLSQAVNSILNQTYKNWEIIFWDNQSTDNSAKIFKSYRDSRLKYYYANEHTNLGVSRNLVIEKSKGDFIAFLDTDDLWDKNKLELQMSYFNNPEVGVVYSNLWIITKNTKKKRLYTNEKLPRGNIYNELIKDYKVGILTAVVRKKIYVKLKKKFDERFSIIQDFDFFIRLSKLSTFESIQTPLASYRLHGENLSINRIEDDISEHEIWLKENENDLSLLNVKNKQKEIDNKKFVNYKINGNYMECIKIILNLKKNLLNIKNLLIFVMPKIILKKFLWYYN